MYTFEVIMEYKQAKERFIRVWGTLGSRWGINRTMAQIHGLLLTSPEALSADEVMEQLNISRGNANMNLRALVDWGLVERTSKLGERKEFFKAEKDLLKISRQVMIERRKRELEPMTKALEEIQDVTGDDEKAVKEFNLFVKDLKNYSRKADMVMNAYIKSTGNQFFDALRKLL